MELFKGSSTHRPLSGDEIRTLILHPAPFDDPICCSLKYISLEDQPGYEALSYAWGDPSNTIPVVLDGEPYPVTINLERALRHLRHPSWVRTLWVDAVCINQKDLKERSAQVRRMRHIYEQAAQVVVWLGDYETLTKEQVESAFQFAKRLATVINVRYDWSQIRKDYVDASSNVWNDCNVLFNMLLRPWFSRTWVLQEVAVSKHLGDDQGVHPVFVCGHSSIGFLTFLAVLINLQRNLHYSGPAALDKNYADQAACIFQFRRLRGQLTAGEAQATPVEMLIHFLSMGTQFEATDERDKIYAFLGLLPPDALPPTLEPSYEYSASRVFWDYAVYILKESRCVDILRCCSGIQRDVPSWVPDWTSGERLSSLHVAKMAYLRLLDDNKKIEVDCMFLSRIETVIHPVDIPIVPDDVAKVYPDLSHEGMMKSLKRMFETVAAVYSALLDVERSRFGRRALDTLSGPELQSWINFLCTGYDSTTPRDFGHFRKEDLYAKLMNMGLGTLQRDFCEPGFMEDMGSFVHTIWVKFRRSSWQDTDGGHGAPLGRHVRPAPDDHICHLRGSLGRFILRAEGAEYRIVGTAGGQIPWSGVDAEDLRKWEQFWDENRHKTRRVILH